MLNEIGQSFGNSRERRKYAVGRAKRQRYAGCQVHACEKCTMQRLDILKKVNRSFRISLDRRDGNTQLGLNILVRVGRESEASTISTIRSAHSETASRNQAITTTRAEGTLFGDILNKNGQNSDISRHRKNRGVDS